MDDFDTKRVFDRLHPLSWHLLRCSPRCPHGRLSRSTIGHHRRMPRLRYWCRHANSSREGPSLCRRSYLCWSRCRYGVLSRTYVPGRVLPQVDPWCRCLLLPMGNRTVNFFQNFHTHFQLLICRLSDYSWPPSSTSPPSLVRTMVLTGSPFPFNSCGPAFSPSACSSFLNLHVTSSRDTGTRMPPSLCPACFPSPSTTPPYRRNLKTSRLT